MDAAEIVSGLRRGDPAAVAETYDRYAARLYGYCAILLSHTGIDHEAPAAALRAAFVAACTADQPASPHRLAPWLYALCRREASLLQVTVVERPTGPLPVLPTATSAAPGAAVVSRLDRDGREMIELSHRHGLTSAEVAAVVGIPEPLAASRLAATQADFAHLYTQLVGPDWSEGLASYGWSPLPGLPAGLREQVLAAVRGAAAVHRPGGRSAMVTGEASELAVGPVVPPLPRPVPVTAPRSRRPFGAGRSVLVAAVAVVAVLVGGGAVAAFVRMPAEPSSRTSVVEPLPLDGALAGSGAPAPTTAAPKPSASPPPKRTRPPTVRPSPTRKRIVPRVSVALRKISTGCPANWQARIAATVAGHPVGSVTITYGWAGYQATRLAVSNGAGEYLIKPAGLPYNTVITYQAEVTRKDGKRVLSAPRTVRQSACRR